MALETINSNLELSATDFEQVTAMRNLKGYHVYYQGTGYVEKAFTFNLSQAVNISDTVAAIVIYFFENMSKFNVSLRGRLGESIQALCYESSVSGGIWTRKAYNVMTDGKSTPQATFDYKPTKGIHILRASMEKRKIQFYVDEKKLLKKPVSAYNLRSLIVETEKMVVYEAHYIQAKEVRSAVFRPNGFEVTETPALYPGSYVEFSGIPLDDKRSWIQIRYHLDKPEPNETQYFRKQEGPVKNKLNVVLKFYEEHISIWSGEGFQAVVSTVFRTPRCLAIYEYVVDELIMCVQSS
ncbi:uncharacterized protein LOC144107466 [Amblyomma americanum]